MGSAWWLLAGRRVLEGHVTRSSGQGLFAPRWTFAILGLAALALLLFLAQGDSESAGTFIVPSEVKIHISYDGACGPPSSPLTLNTKITETESITTTQQKPIDVGGLISGCVGTTTDPGTVQIDGELFDYANLSTYTAAGLLATANPPFDLAVRTDNMSAFPASGFIYVGGERMSYSSRTTNSFHITARSIAPSTHSSDSFVRAEGKLILVGRRQPTRNSGWNPTPPNPALPPGATDDQQHGTGATVRAPDTHLTCRGRFTQTVVSGGNDRVDLRYRCYTRLDPDGPWPDVDYTTPPYITSPAQPPYVTSDPSTGPPLALTPALYHGTASGTLNEATGVLTLNTEVFGLTCIPYVPGHLWVRITQVINLNKTPVDTDPGTFSIFAYADDQCAGPTVAILGNDAPNATYITTDGPSTGPGTPTPVPSYDTDKDGCTDYRELGTIANPQGGQRDPFNPFDYSDINHDGAVTAGVDVLGIAQTFGVPARYVDYKDRGNFVPDAVDGLDDAANSFDGNGPNIWNTKAPNNNINSGGDVLGAARQFGHSCPHTHGAVAPYGAHPTTVTTTVTIEQSAPFAMSVGTTSGFPPSGTLLVDAETLTYDQNSPAPACSSLVPATQFCITARGSGTPSGNIPDQHTVGKIVFQKTP